MSAPNASSALPPEQVVRFIYERAHLFENGDAKWKAFEPSRRDNTTSVFIIDGLTLQQVWELGELMRPLPVVAGARITPANVRAVGLELEVDNTPPRHAAVTLWPEDKPEVKALAQALAAMAVVRRR